MADLVPHFVSLVDPDLLFQMRLGVGRFRERQRNWRGHQRITAYCEEPAEGRKANVSRGPNGPFRDAHRLVARNADRDGEAIALDLHLWGAIGLSPRWRRRHTVLLESA